MRTENNLRQNKYDTLVMSLPPSSSTTNHNNLIHNLDHSLNRPPQTLANHNYNSSISSISSTNSSMNSISSPPPKNHHNNNSINYSPKHSRNPNSFTFSRNMKNLSLNLESNSIPTNSSSSDSSSTHRDGVPNTTTQPLQTPCVTQTPTLPPKIADPPDSIDSYKFPPVSDDRNDITPPIPPPFAFSNSIKHHSPIYTPPALHSPNRTTHQRQTPKSKTNSPLDTSFSQNLTYDSKKFLPNNTINNEELQEKSLVNAYPNGPRNVLNNLIYLYSDPNVSSKARVIDMSEFSLVINVAKECKDLSRNFKNLEYLYLPWSHNSSISKDLLYLTEKIESYYTKNLKILVHCQCGVSRSACVVVAFLMRKFKIDVNKAYDILRNGDAELNIDKCDRICPNMSLIFELMEFSDILNNQEITTQQLLLNSPPKLNI